MSTSAVTSRNFALFGCLALSILSAALFTYFYSSFSLDDAAIYQRIVKNLAYHGTYSYNLHEQVNPGTSVLYPLLLSFLAFVIPHNSLQTLAVFADALLVCGGTLALASFIWRNSGSIVATTISGLACFFVEMSQLFGMEAALLFFCMGLYLNTFSNDRVRQTLVALFPLVRPEGVVFLGVEGAYLVWRSRFEPKSCVRSAVKALPILLPLVLSCTASWWLFGEALPHSATNKLAQGSGGWQTYRSFLKGLAFGCVGSSQQALVLSVAVVGAAFTLLRSLTAAVFFFIGVGLWQFGLIILKAPYYTWYSLSLFFAIFVAVCLGVAAIEKSLKRLLSPSLVTACSLVAASAFLSWSWWRVIPNERLSPESRQLAHSKLASFITEVHKGRHARVAALEVGHLGNALDEKIFSIYDLCGLTSKNKGFFQPGFYDDFFCEAHPEYVVLNLFQLQPLTPTSASDEVEGSVVTRYSTAEYHKVTWPHHVGMVLDPRFTQAYEYIGSTESAGYPGGFAVFRFRDSFSCADSVLSVERVTASREHDVNTSAQRAIDGDLASSWNAGDGHIQWLHFDFARPQSISRIRLWANQDREYQSRVRLRFWADPKEPAKVIELPITVLDGDLIEIKLAAPQEASRVEVESVRGHNWAAWREVEFFSR